MGTMVRVNYLVNVYNNSSIALEHCDGLRANPYLRMQQTKYSSKNLKEARLFYLRHSIKGQAARVAAVLATRTKITCIPWDTDDAKLGAARREEPVAGESPDMTQSGSRMVSSYSTSVA